MQSRVAALSIVKTLDVLKDDEPGLLPTVEIVTINAFPFESAEETLHRRVIVTVARSTHAHHDAYICQPGQISPAGVGAALIRVQKHLSGRRAADKRHLES